MNSIGFIILRHVTNETSALYWKQCYARIRRFHPEVPILLIDDASNSSFIREEDEEMMQNVRILRSEYPGRGELLPYYYYIHIPFCDKVCILHDSVFLNAPVNFDTPNYTILWTFEHWYDVPDQERSIISCLNNSVELLEFYEKKEEWKGCFGCMSIVRHSYLKMLDERYDFSRLLEKIKTRSERCLFERVIACILQFHGPHRNLFGDIYAYCPWGVTYNQWKQYTHLPAIKVWSSR